MDDTLPPREPQQRRPIRLGYHGSQLVAQQVADLAGDRHDVELEEYDIADPFRALRHGLLDVMIAKFAMEEPDLVCGPVLSLEPRAAVVGANHSLAARHAVSIEEVASYGAFAAPGRMPSYVWDHVVPPKTPEGRPIARAHRAATVPELMDRVTRTEAVHITLASLADVAPPTVRVIPIPDLPPAPVMLTWRRDLRLEHVHAFIVDTAQAVVA